MLSKEWPGTEATFSPKFLPLDSQTSQMNAHVHDVFTSYGGMKFEIQEKQFHNISRHTFSTRVQFCQTNVHTRQISRLSSVLLLSKLLSIVSHSCLITLDVFANFSSIILRTRTDGL